METHICMKIISLRRSCNSNQHWACFVSYLNIINILLENNISILNEEGMYVTMTHGSSKHLNWSSWKRRKKQTNKQTKNKTKTKKQTKTKTKNTPYKIGDLWLHLLLSKNTQNPYHSYYLFPCFCSDINYNLSYEWNEGVNCSCRQFLDLGNFMLKNFETSFETVTIVLFEHG